MARLNYRYIILDNCAPQSTGMFILKLYKLLFLYQHVLEPTRFRDGHAPSVLDLLFTNEEDMISNLNYEPGLEASDYCLLSFDLNCYIQTESIRNSVYNFNKGDFCKMKELYDNIDCVACLSHRAVEDAWIFFHDLIMSAMDNCIPCYEMD